MRTNRRSFIKQSVSATSTGLLLPNLAMAMDDSTCKPTTLRPYPNIRVFFSGLLLYQFRPDINAVCDISPLEDVGGHYFSVVVKAREGDGAPYTLWRYLDKPKHQMVLSVNGATPGVLRHRPTPEPFVRCSPDNDCMDWRWTLHIQDFLQPGEDKPKFDEGKFSPGIQIRQGVFYTAIKTNGERTRVTRRNQRDETDEQNLCSVGSVAGVNIYFDEFTGAELEIESEGTVDLPKLDGVKYEIYVEYDPRKPVLPSGEREGTTSYFHKYYDAMKKPKPRKLYHVKYYDIRRDKSLKSATPDVPCMGLGG